MLITFFVLGSVATKYKQLNKESAMPYPDPHVMSKLGRGEGQRETTTAAWRGRDCWQVMATGGLPAAFCLLDYWPWAANTVVKSWLWPSFAPSLSWLMVMACLACCLGDTLASEIGMLSKQEPKLILSFRPCKPGCDGGVSLLGTIASIWGGLLIGIWSGSVAGCFYGAVFGCVGSALDSMLGCLLQTRPAMPTPTLTPAANRQPVSFQQWKRMNNLVNLLSVLLTGLWGVWLVKAEGTFLWFINALALPAFLLVSSAPYPIGMGQRID